MGKSGKKRKNEDSEEHIKEKIRRLETQLQRKKTRRRIISSSSSEDEPNNVCDNHSHALSPVSTIASALDLESKASSISNSAPENRVADLPDDKLAHSEELQLDEKILELLGDAPKTEIEFGKPIHKDIAGRWQEILNKGLGKEAKDKLLKEYLVPSNCDFLVAPLLNPEIKVALSEPLVKRDLGLMTKQKQIGIAIAALSHALEMAIAKDVTSDKVIKSISDACRILCDSHYADTRTRRGFVLSVINNELKDAVTESERTKYLFGDNISDKLKSAKSVQKSGEILKQTQKSSVFNKANFVATSKNNKGHLNYKIPHRKQTSTSRADAGKFRSNWRTMRSTDRPPAPPPPLPSSQPMTPAPRAFPPRRRHYN